MPTIDNDICTTQVKAHLDGHVKVLQIVLLSNCAAGSMWKCFFMA